MKFLGYVFVVGVGLPVTVLYVIMGVLTWIAKFLNGVGDAICESTVDVIVNTGFAIGNLWRGLSAAWERHHPSRREDRSDR